MNVYRNQLKAIIFDTESRLGKLFDIILIITIVLSIFTVLLDSVTIYHFQYHKLLYTAEWIFTILFTLEYLLRIFCIRHPFLYIFSFFGIIDFLAIIPTYLSLFIPGSEVLIVIRVLRVLRIFRILKLFQYIYQVVTHIISFFFSNTNPSQQCNVLDVF